MGALRILATLVATVVLAPSLTFVVFTTLMADEFRPGETLSQLADYLEAMLLHGDLGYSFYYAMPMTEVILDGLPADLAMLLGGLAFGLLVGVGAGLLAIDRPGSPLVRVFDVLAAVGISMPVYWMGFAVLILFAGTSGILLQLPFISSAGEYRSLPSDPIAFVRALWVPIVVVGTPVAAGLYRMTIGTGREVLAEDFVRTARSKGLRQGRVLRGHVLPVAAIPLLVFSAAQVNLLITNVALLQSAFNIPGTFRELPRALTENDLTMIQAMIVESCILIALANAFADACQTKLDPRVRDRVRAGVRAA